MTTATSTPTTNHIPPQSSQPPSLPQTTSRITTPVQGPIYPTGAEASSLNPVVILSSSNESKRTRAPPPPPLPPPVTPRTATVVATSVAIPPLCGPMAANPTHQTVVSPISFAVTDGLQRGTMTSTIPKHREGRSPTDPPPAPILSPLHMDASMIPPLMGTHGLPPTSFKVGEIPSFYPQRSSFPTSTFGIPAPSVSAMDISRAHTPPPAVTISAADVPISCATPIAPASAPATPTIKPFRFGDFSAMRATASAASSPLKSDTRRRSPMRDFSFKEIQRNVHQIEDVMAKKRMHLAELEEQIMRSSIKFSALTSICKTFAKQRDQSEAELNAFLESAQKSGIDTSPYMIGSQMSSSSFGNPTLSVPAITPEEAEHIRDQADLSRTFGDI